LVIQEKSVLTASDKEVVVISEYDPIVSLRISCDFGITGIVFEDLFDGVHRNIVCSLKRFHVLAGDVLIAENPHLFRSTLSSDRLLSSLFLCPERLHQLWVLVVVFDRRSHLRNIKVQLVCNLIETPLLLSD